MTGIFHNAQISTRISNTHLRMESFGSFTSRTQGANPDGVFLISSKFSFQYPHICPYSTSHVLIASVPPAGCSQPHVELQGSARTYLWAEGGQRWQGEVAEVTGVLCWWQHSENTSRAFLPLSSLPCFYSHSISCWFPPNSYFMHIHSNSFQRLGVISMLEYRGENMMMFIVTGIWQACDHFHWLSWWSKSIRRLK